MERVDNGKRIATLFRQARGLAEQKCCDLDALLIEDDIEVVDSRDPNPGYTACLMRAPQGMRGGGIWLAPGQDRGRRHFSIAHELGHYHIPSHASRELGRCGEADLRAKSTDSAILEWEANSFAAELLMPKRQFTRDSERRDISFAAAIELASQEHYDVSITAAAWRIVQVSNERCALVLTTDGMVSWVASSSNFRAFTERGVPPRVGTLAEDSAKRQVAEPRPLEVDASTWFDGAPVGASRLLESTHLIPSQRQVLSLLWIPQEE